MSAATDRPRFATLKFALRVVGGAATSEQSSGARRPQISSAVRAVETAERSSRRPGLPPTWGVWTSPVWTSPSRKFRVVTLDTGAACSQVHSRGEFHPAHPYGEGRSRGRLGGDEFEERRRPTRAPDGSRLAGPGRSRFHGAPLRAGWRATSGLGSARPGFSRRVVGVDAAARVDLDDLVRAHLDGSERYSEHGRGSRSECDGRPGDAARPRAELDVLRRRRHDRQWRLPSHRRPDDPGD